MRGILTIVGPGTLGRSLAGWAALQGFEVRLAGRDLAQAETARDQVERHWRRGVEKGHLSRERVEAASSRLQPFPSGSSAVEGAEILLEALPEDLELKARAWHQLHHLASPGTLLLTGSSSLPLASLTQAAGIGTHLLGFHLFVPVDRMQLVELVIPDGVLETKIERASEFGEQLNLQVVRVKDVPGYAASRMALAQGLEAMRLLESGVASASDIDILMVKGYGHPLGPLALSDHIGLDLRLSIADGIFRATGESRFEPPPILRAMVGQGFLGRKTGRGFHLWENR